MYGFYFVHQMPSGVLFSNASFDQPAQATVLRSIESVKRKVLEDDTLKLYESCLSKNNDCEKKEETLNSSKSILKSVDECELEHNKINTITESQTPKIEVSSDMKPLVKKRKIKMIPNKIEIVKKEDAKTKTVNFMTKVRIMFNVYKYPLLYYS